MVSLLVVMRIDRFMRFYCSTNKRMSFSCVILLIKKYAQYDDVIMMLTI